MPATSRQMVDCVPQAPHDFLRTSSAVEHTVPGTGGGGPASGGALSLGLASFASGLPASFGRLPLLLLGGSVVPDSSVSVSVAEVSSTAPDDPSALQPTTVTTPRVPATTTVTRPDVMRLIRGSLLVVDGEPPPGTAPALTYFTS